MPRDPKLPPPLAGCRHSPTRPRATARFTEAYALIPAAVQRDIVTSNLPHWRAARAWVLARPMTGFAETFAHYLMEVAPGGGSDAPEPDRHAEAVIFVTGGQAALTIDGTAHQLVPGGYAYIPAGAAWMLAVPDGAGEPAVFHWIRKHYDAVEGIDHPPAFVTSDQAVAPTPMPDCDGVWATTRFVDPDDLRHDMHVNIVTFQPGGRIPFAETHVMEHALFVLQGTGRYLLNTRLGRCRRRRHDVASRLLPAGLHRHRRRAVPLPALQGRQQAHAAQPRRADAGTLSHTGNGTIFPYA